MLNVLSFDQQKSPATPGSLPSVTRSVNTSAGIAIRNQEDFDHYLPGNSYDPSVSLSKNIVRICQPGQGNLPAEGTFILENFEYSVENFEYANSNHPSCRLPEIFVIKNGRISSGHFSFFNGDAAIVGAGITIGSDAYPTMVQVYGENGVVHVKVADTHGHACGAGSKVIAAADRACVSAEHPEAIVTIEGNFNDVWLTTYKEHQANHADSLYRVAQTTLAKIERNPTRDADGVKRVLAYLTQASEWGHAEASWELKSFDFNGDKFEWSYEKEALAYFEQAEQQGYVGAKGEPTFKDRLFVAELQIRSAKGEARASLGLGMVTLRGEKGVKQSYGQAIDYFKLAEKQYDQHAEFLADQPILTYQDLKTLQEQLTLACDGKAIQDLKDHANILDQPQGPILQRLVWRASHYKSLDIALEGYSNNEAFKEAVTALQELKKAVSALHELGMCHLEGKFGLEKNKEKALDYLLEASDMGNAASSKQVSDIYFSMRDELKSEENNICGLYRLILAAEQGNADALYELGKKYFPDSNASYELSKKPCAGGQLPRNDQDLNEILIKIYNKQEGYKKAIAAFLLGELCMRNSWSTNGVNFKEAIKWYELAQKNHHSGAGEKLAIYRKIKPVEQTLNSDDNKFFSNPGKDTLSVSSVTKESESLADNL